MVEWISAHFTVSEEENGCLAFFSFRRSVSSSSSVSTSLFSCPHFAGWRDFRSSRWQMNHRHTWLEMTKDYRKAGRSNPKRRASKLTARLSELEYLVRTAHLFCVPWAGGAFSHLPLHISSFTFVFHKEVVYSVAQHLVDRAPRFLLGFQWSRVLDRGRRCCADVLAVPLLCSILLLFLSPVPEFLSCCVL